MPCMGPSENPLQVDEAYDEIMELLKIKYNLLSIPISLINHLNPNLRTKRLADFKEALRLLFQLDSWEGF